MEAILSISPSLTKKKGFLCRSRDIIRERERILETPFDDTYVPLARWVSGRDR